MQLWDSRRLVEILLAELNDFEGYIWWIYYVVKILAKCVICCKWNMITRIK